jgi:tRNA(Ile)-lysidine synthase
MDLLTRVRHTIGRHELAGERTRVVVALSGGPDSVALAHVLATLAREGTLTVAGAAHFNHTLRAASGADERFCRDLAGRLGWPFVADRGDVAARARIEKRSIEDAARAMRYEFFERALAQLTADVVALGHTRDDQAETFLLRLLRGAGARGLAAMRPRRGRYIRPLIDCRRAELKAFLDAGGFAYIVDETNADVAIPRNRVRAELLPLLERRFNPSIVDALADAADVAREEWVWLQDAAEPFFRALVTRDDETTWRVDVEGLNELAPALARATLHRAMTSAAHGRTVPFRHVLAALEVSRGAPPFDAPSQRVERHGGFLVLRGRPPGAVGRMPPAGATANLFRYPLSIPGEVQILETGCWISAARGAPLDSNTADLRATCGTADLHTTARVRADKVQGALTVRSRQPGDRFRPVGLGGEKKLQDFFVDRKVPRDERDRIPLVVDARDRIVWVAGHAVDDEFRVTDPAQSVLLLRLRHF